MFHIKSSHFYLTPAFQDNDRVVPSYWEQDGMVHMSQHDYSDALNCPHNLVHNGLL